MGSEWTNPPTLSIDGFANFSGFPVEFGEHKTFVMSFTPTMLPPMELTIDSSWPDGVVLSQISYEDFLELLQKNRDVQVQIMFGEGGKILQITQMGSGRVRIAR